MDNDQEKQEAVALESGKTVYRNISGHKVELTLDGETVVVQANDTVTVEMRFSKQMQVYIKEFHLV